MRDKENRGPRSVAFICLLLSFCLVMSRKYLHAFERERDNKQEVAAIASKNAK